MKYSEVQEKLILSNLNQENHAFLEIEFPYVQSYEILNLKIIDASKNGATYINFDFIDCDLNEIKNNTLADIEKESEEFIRHIILGHMQLKTHLITRDIFLLEVSKLRLKNL